MFIEFCDENFESLSKIFSEIAQQQSLLDLIEARPKKQQQT